MAYADRVEVNLQTGVITTQAADDAWVRASTRQVLISADKMTLLADNTDTATVTVQLSTHALVSTGLPANVSESVPLTLSIDGVNTDIQTDGSGRYQFTVTTAQTGAYDIYCANVYGNTLSITGV